jgi:uncharacterized repeat protein (TIGR04138 family)
MPPLDEPANSKTLLEVVEDIGTYPIEAYDFLQRGLQFTVQNIHGANPDPNMCRHVSGQQLCNGMRDYALQQWGYLARTVLRRWNITTTFDFGRMVFALIDNGLMQKTDDDTIEDFRNVYDFKTALEGNYRIGNG